MPRQLGMGRYWIVETIKTGIRIFNHTDVIELNYQLKSHCLIWVTLYQLGNY